MPDQIEKIVEEFKKSPERLEMPGNPRYQPESMKPYFGYDNIARFYFEVEWALLKALAELGILPKKTRAILKENLFQFLRQQVRTTMEDAIEKAVTKHDIRALLAIIRHLLSKTRLRSAQELNRWLHIPATSYDIIDTARAVAYKRAFWEVSLPSLLELIASLREKAMEFSGLVQIGRTHGQHAEPITVGFWLATILARILDITEHLIAREKELVGKFSGPVGAYNSQVLFGFEEKAGKMFNKTFEEMILNELGLESGPISTQIVLPEPLARFLFELTLLSAALGQLSRDCRNLQRTEIAEVGEPFGEGQDGSSAMPHKRNPITWEGVEGIYTIVRNEFHKVLDVMVTDHQRDATNMCVMREFPGIVVLTQHQIETANRILPRISVNRQALDRNFGISKNQLLSEAMYILLVMGGYEGDAHNFVNHVLVPQSQVADRPLIEVFTNLAADDPKLYEVIHNTHNDIGSLLWKPEEFIGKAKEKTLKVAQKADDFLKKYNKEGVN